MGSQLILQNSIEADSRCMNVEITTNVSDRNETNQNRQPYFYDIATRGIRPDAGVSCSQCDVSGADVNRQTSAYVTGDKGFRNIEKLYKTKQQQK